MTSDEVAQRTAEARMRTAETEQKIAELTLSRLQFEFDWAREKSELKRHEFGLELERVRHENRPSSHFKTCVHQEPDGKFECERDGIKALGDTPEMACDNLDHVWLYGGLGT